MSAEERSTIVVGNDGSRSSAEAFEFALELAEKLGADLVAIRAWTVDTAPRGALVDHGYVSSFDEVSQKVRDKLEESTRQSAARHPAVRVSYRGVLGHPAAVLMEASAASLMLVIGSRGRGGFSSLLLGSVSEQCVRHATCPVLVVRR
jgi:nucleotide-binding universal stress UspA family protein